MGSGPSNFVNHASGEAIISGLSDQTNRLGSLLSQNVYNIIYFFVIGGLILSAGYGLYKYCKYKQRRAKNLTRQLSRELIDLNRKIEHISGGKIPATKPSAPRYTPPCYKEPIYNEVCEGGFYGNC
ncbi:p14 FAST [Mahlapitsi orthoreovirus]|uniref:p14 FAST n=1 Tax=Mahlapitsi orthoreovirus TaxID=2170064 RepID=A0A3G1DHN7_9REOV|nr:p14 FAST [Mahlapitsi orthoreovirus]AMU04180.1 p14 FAST [Mahlapitsi orthoreovirus]AMU04191.1 p14 FAST [Mahlapitsi orthoreovirus]